MINAAYEIHDLEPFELSSKTGPKGRPLYRKQVAYVGEFLKRQPGQKDREFEIDLPTLHHWHRTFNAWKDDGVEVPMPLGHTEDPEKRRATVVDMVLGKDKKGRDSLFEIVEFKDEKAENDLKHSDVSIFVPPEVTLGNKKTYQWPIRHTAFTDYPVLPGLEPFESVALSLAFGVPPTGPGLAPVAPIAPVAPAQGNLMINLAKMLGIPETTPAPQLEQMILSKVQSLLKPAVPGAPAVRPPIAAGFITLAKKDRKRDITDLVGNGITKAVADDLEGIFCSDDSLALSLSTDGSATDNFEKIMTALKKNEAFVTGERTGLQLAHASRLKKKDSKELSPLQRNAAARAERAKKEG